MQSKTGECTSDHSEVTRQLDVMLLSNVSDFILSDVTLEDVVSTGNEFVWHSWCAGRLKGNLLLEMRRELKNIYLILGYKIQYPQSEFSAGVH